jgi:hypothetical protein
MKPWNQRPFEVRNLFNPAFCGMVLFRALHGFEEEDPAGMPFSLSLLVLPLCLHTFPQFLMIDQPTQVYFPSEKVYQEADGSIQKTEADADLIAVRRLFSWLLKFTQDLAPGFQIIVTEHANLRDQWFQEALVEEPWAKPPALVPENWPDQ